MKTIPQTAPPRAFAPSHWLRTLFRAYLIGGAMWLAGLWRERLQSTPTSAWSFPSPPKLPFAVTLQWRRTNNTEQQQDQRSVSRVSGHIAALAPRQPQMDYPGCESVRAPWVCHQPRTRLCEPGTQGGCSQVEEPNLSQQAPKQLCKCMNRDNISIMRPVLYHQSLQKALKPDLPPSTDSASVIAPYY